MKYTYKVEGLDCANCTAKLERELKKIDNVHNLSLSFMNKKLMYETDDDTVYDQILAVIDKVEPDVTVIGVNMAIDDEEECHHEHKHHHEHGCGCGHHKHSHHDEHECNCKHDHHHEHDHECCINHEHKTMAIGSKSLIIDGLDCANCASKIEYKLNQSNKLNNVSINFMAKTLTYDSNMNEVEDINYIQKIVNSVEDGVKILSNNKEVEKVKYDNDLIKIIGAFILFILAIFIKNELISFILFALAYILVGLEVLLKAIKNIFKGKVFDENFLMAIATIGAILIKDYAEGVAVMLFYQVGEYFQKQAVDNSRKSISELMDIKQDFAHLKVDDKLEIVKPEEVKVNDLIVCKPGEIIPLDGIIVSGSASLNTSALTGESMLQEVTVNDEVLSGVINTNGLLTIKVSKTYNNGTINKILDMVENASSRKTKTENFITTFARYYTPIVCLLALVIGFVVPLFIEGRPFDEYIYRGLSFLVVSCPCALVISIPLGYFSGIGGLSKRGILVKGSNYIETLSKVDTILMDKTGTITEGKFKVTKVSNKETLEIAALLESNSNHPIALSIVDYYGQDIDLSRTSDLEEIQGKGIKANVDGLNALCGNSKLMDLYNIQYASVNEVGTIVHVALDKQYLGYIVIKDNIKNTSIKAINNLKKVGIKNIVMLTGDNEKVANSIAEEVKVNKVYSSLLPDQKVEICAKYIEEGHKVAFVGDGINDAPVLALADVGISMGSLGSDAAIEASDVVLMHDDLNSIIDALAISKKTQRIVIENIFIALGIKIMVLLLVSFGIADMWAAVFADVGVAIIAICNSIRGLK